MTRNISEIARNCTRRLSGHDPRTVRNLLLSVAESPLALMPSDMYGRGGFLTDFEREVADLLGKEAAAFMPSGTMAQPISLRLWADESGCKNVAFHPTCHLELHEHHGYRLIHGLNAILLGGPDRLFTLADLEAVDEEVSTLLIELPQREIGGQLPTWEELSAVCAAARARKMRLHLDGARLWECRPYYGRSYAEICALFDSVYVSLYKILGGLPGAILAGPSSFIEEAKLWQRRQGGNLQQQSPAVISAKLGMETHLPRITEYVGKAGEVAEMLGRFPQVSVVPERPPTNMMHLHFKGDAARLLDASLTIAEEEKVGLFFLLREGKTEVTIGSAALRIEAEELETLFGKLFELAGR